MDHLPSTSVTKIFQTVSVGSHGMLPAASNGHLTLVTTVLVVTQRHDCCRHSNTTTTV